MSYNFKDTDAVKANWWKLENVGDNIQGTYVRKFEQTNPASGNIQICYEIKKDNGEFWNVGGKPAIDAQMRNINIGQIVKFEYIEERPSKSPTKSAAKIVQVFSNKDAIDQEWLQEQEANPSTNNESDNSIADLTEEGQELTANDVFPDTQEDKNAKIIVLAKEKLDVTDETKVKEAVMEKTGLAYINSNLEAIIEKLEAM